jgi:hypothetical protein
VGEHLAGERLRDGTDPHDRITVRRLARLARALAKAGDRELAVADDAESECGDLLLKEEDLPIDADDFVEQCISSRGPRVAGEGGDGYAAGVAAGTARME